MGSTAKLYEITNEMVVLMDAMEEDEGALERLSELYPDLKDKVMMCVRAHRMMVDEATTMKARAQVFADQAKVLENKAKRFKDYIAHCMETVNADKIVHGGTEARFQKNPPSMEITDERVIPRKFWVKPPPVLDKRAILAALKDGQKVKGASMKPDSFHLRIK